MFYRTREFVDERLRLARRQSYRIVPATPSGRIKDTSVVLLLNASRVGIDEPLTNIPCDLMTPEEAVRRFDGITLRDLNRWTHRKLRVVPHFRLNRYTIRFSEAMLGEWLSRNSAA